MNGRAFVRAKLVGTLEAAPPAAAAKSVGALLAAKGSDGLSADARANLIRAQESLQKLANVKRPGTGAEPEEAQAMNGAASPEPSKKASKSEDKSSKKNANKSEEKKADKKADKKAEKKAKKQEATREQDEDMPAYVQAGGEEPPKKKSKRDAKEAIAGSSGPPQVETHAVPLPDKDKRGDNKKKRS